MLVHISMVLKKVKMGHELGKNRPVVNHLLFIDDLELLAKSENKICFLMETVQKRNNVGMRFVISKCDYEERKEYALL